MPAYVAGTFDTKGDELRFIAACLSANGIKVRLVDLGTRPAANTDGIDVSAEDVAAWHPQGAERVFVDDRGAAVTAMSEAFDRFVQSRDDVDGLIAAGGSGAAALVAPAMRGLAIGKPKVLVTTMASGDVGPYVGGSDLTLMFPVTDVQGLNSVSRAVLSNAAHALAGMIAFRAPAAQTERQSIGLTMFGVTTPCVQRVAASLEHRFDCLVFSATSAGTGAMEKLVASGLAGAVIDVTTTDVADLLVGGIFPASEDRFGAVIRSGVPYVGSVGALDMVNFGAPDSIPPKFKGRRLHRHNANVTLMRTTAEECATIGDWIAQRLNRMSGPVRFLLPLKGLSALDASGQPFFAPDADLALFDALRKSFEPSDRRRLLQIDAHINDPAFADAVLAAFADVHA